MGQKRHIGISFRKAFQYSISTIIILHLFRSSIGQQVNPGDSINQALGRLGEENRNLASKLETALMMENARLHKMEQWMNALDSSLDGLTKTTIPEMQRGMTEMQRGMTVRIDDIISKMVSIDTTVEALTSEVSRLDNANRIWKQNFRIVDNTFNNLQKKVSLKGFL